MVHLGLVEGKPAADVADCWDRSMAVVVAVAEAGRTGVAAADMDHSQAVLEKALVHRYSLRQYSAAYEWLGVATH